MVKTKEEKETYKRIYCIHTSFNIFADLQRIGCVMSQLQQPILLIRLSQLPARLKVVYKATADMSCIILMNKVIGHQLGVWMSFFPVCKLVHAFLDSVSKVEGSISGKSFRKTGRRNSMKGTMINTVKGTSRKRSAQVLISCKHRKTGQIELKV